LTTPYIDFASSSQDYDARIRLTAPGQLAIEGANVGIGTITPSARLDVGGDIKASSITDGDITARNNVTATSITFKSQKVCSPWTGSNWRDTVIVPATWTKELCSKFAKWQTADNYSLGCITDVGFNFGDGVNPPSPNCGW
jgi:hypothetical protein